MAWKNIKYTSEKADKAIEEMNFTAVENGWYEVFITSVNPNKVAKTGSKGIEVVFTIRDDVEQEGQGRKIFENFWVEDAQGNESKALPRLFALARRIGAPDMEISPEAVIDVLFAKPVRVEIEKYQYKNKSNEEVDANRVTFMGFEEAKVGGRFQGENPVKLVSKEDDPFAGVSTSSDDGDFPFA